MLFRRKEPKQDIHEIKEAMDKPLEEMPTQRPQPAPVPQPVTPQRTAGPDSLGAPLFVKVDKYREILSTIQEMKLFVSSVKQLFTILHELETVRGDAINIMRATVQRLEKSMMEVDSELLRPRGVSMGQSSSNVEVTHIEDTLTELQKQLGELRKELQGMR